MCVCVCVCVCVCACVGQPAAALRALSAWIERTGVRSVRVPSLGELRGTLYRESIGIPGYHSKEVSALTYLSQLACVVLTTPSWAPASSWTASMDGQGQPHKLKRLKLTPVGWHSPSKWMGEAKDALLDTSAERYALKRLCAKAPPLPKGGNTTHNLEASLFRMRKRHEPDTLRGTIHPLPPKYPQLC